MKMQNFSKKIICFDLENIVKVKKLMFILRINKGEGINDTKSTTTIF